MKNISSILKKFLQDIPLNHGGYDGKCKLHHADNINAMQKAPWWWKSLKNARDRKIGFDP